MGKKKKQIVRNQIYHGHALDVLKSFPSNYFNMILTSPPYWATRIYEGHPLIWDADPTCEHEWIPFVKPKQRGSVAGGVSMKIDDSGKRVLVKTSRAKGWVRPSRTHNPGNIKQISFFCENCSAWKGDLGNEPFIGMYVKHLADIADQLKRVLRNDGVFWLNLGDVYYGTGGGQKFTGKQSYMPRKYSVFPSSTKPNLNKELPRKCMSDIPHRVILELVNRGWIHRSTVIWQKPNAIPRSVSDRPTEDYEYLFMLTKTGRYYYDLQYEPIKDSTRRTYSSGQRPIVGGNKFPNDPHVTKQIYSGKPIKATNYRQQRSVWSINTAQFPEAHFAVMPTELALSPIKSSCPEWVCQTCGKPRVPVYKKVNLTEPRKYGKKTKPLETDSTTLRTDFATIIYLGHTGCKCADYRKGVVLDPFMGAGTTAMVAQALNRDWVGIELSKFYISLAYRRLEHSEH